MNPTSVRNLLLSMGLAAGIGAATNGCSSQAGSPDNQPGAGGSGFGNGLGGLPNGLGGAGGNLGLGGNGNMLHGGVGGNSLHGGAPGTQDASADTAAQGDDATDVMSTDADAAGG